jgi:hypothetical protein
MNKIRTDYKHFGVIVHDLILAWSHLNVMNVCLTSYNVTLHAVKKGKIKVSWTPFRAMHHPLSQQIKKKLFHGNMTKTAIRTMES